MVAMSRDALRHVSLILLRISLAIVFIWFGLLKLFGESPVVDVISQAYPWIAESPKLFFALGLLEVILGVGLFVPHLVTLSAWAMVGHLLVATFGVLISPQAFIDHFPLLSVAGEFVVKNIVLIAGALVLIVYTRDMESSK